jgi:hypothetical protein
MGTVVVQLGIRPGCLYRIFDGGIVLEVVKSNITVDDIIGEAVNDRKTCDGLIFRAWLWQK